MQIKVEDIFDKLTVIGEQERVFYKNSGSSKWKCQCECGEIKYKTSYQLKTWKHHRCKCSTLESKKIKPLNKNQKAWMKLGYPLKSVRAIKDLTGLKFTELTALKVVPRKLAPTRYTRVDKNVFWQCKCDCGKTIIVSAQSLLDGKRLSCGCRRSVRGIGSGPPVTRPWYWRRFISCWYNMLRRCYIPGVKSYDSYGGRGIKVCDEWKKGFMKNNYKRSMAPGFNKFHDDMIDSYLKHVKKHGEKDTTIDRIDNDGDYSKDNCRWATMIQQSANKSTSKKK